MNNNTLLWLDDQFSPLSPDFGFDTKAEKYFGEGYDPKNIVWVRTYDEFCDHIELNGVPSAVSFDYRLNYVLDGLDCAKFLKGYCDANQLSIPKYTVHSNWTGIESDFRKILD